MMLPNQPYLSIVIPAYNEERRLPLTLEKVIAFCETQKYDYEVLVVDDGSTDHTVASVEALASSLPQVQIIRNDHRGKGYAVRNGMLAAHGQIILFTDADLSTPIEETERLLSWFSKDYAVVIGSREGVGAQRYGEPGYRHLMGRVFNLVVRLLAVRGIQDTQCGFKAFRHDAAHRIFERVQLYGEKAGVVTGSMVTGFDVEVLFLARKLGYPIKEVPVQWYYANESKVDPLQDSLRNFRDVVRVRWNDLRGRYRE
ncbi:MAG: glycosyltransferase family 2 protein [Chloroflexi bacterium]|nr:glycosyltransferase family 2 protein [Chloroflexota bacterium]